MKLEFNYGRYNYQYHLELMDRKSMSLVVYPSQRIVVKAPLDTSIEKVEKFLAKKWLWLEEKLAEFKKYQKTWSEREYVTGESHYYLGRQYVLEAQKSDVDKVKLDHGKIIIFTSGELDNYDKNKQIFNQWLERRINIVFKQQFKKAFKQFNYQQMPELRSRKMARRWGSCSLDGTKITLNPRLIQASTEAIYYVCLHELCHVANPKHNREFYDMMLSRIPDWQRVKNELEIRFG